MKKLSCPWAVALLLCFLSPRSSEGTAPGGVGNNNLTGVTGEYNGSITTGGSYDPFTGNAKRFIDDLTVTGSVGAYPIKWTRILNTRGTSGPFGDGGGWRHSYQWALVIRPIPGPTPNCNAPPEPPAGTVAYPDGRVVMFEREVGPTGAETWLQAHGFEPTGDRLVHMGGPNYALKLKDGGRVEFRIVNGLARAAQYIVDPHGLITTLGYVTRSMVSPPYLPYLSLETITEPAGRYLHIEYFTYPRVQNANEAYREVTVIKKVTVFDGPQAHQIEKVIYDYQEVLDETTGLLRARFFNLIRANYDEGPPAEYVYTNPALVTLSGWSLAAGNVEKCNDVRFAGAMSKIKYEYVPAGPISCGGTARGQIKAERNLTTNALVSTVSYPSPPCLSTNLRTETRGDGATRKFVYDAGGELESYSDFAYASDPTKPHYWTTITVTPLAPGNDNHYLRKVTDARTRDRTSEIQRIPDVGALMAVIHHNGSRVTHTYSDLNNPNYVASTTDENLKTTYYDRYEVPGFPPDPDNPNRVWRIRYPDYGEELFTYNHFGQVTWHRLTSGGEERFTYDTRGLKETYTPPQTPSDLTPWNNPTRYFYYTTGPHKDRLRYVQDPRGNTTEYQYNLRGLVTKVIHPDTKFIENEYNDDGTLRWTTDELRHKTTYTYDEYKRVTGVKNHLDESITTSYAPNGVNPFWHTTSLIYTTTSHLQKVTAYGYDANFRRKWMTVAPGTNDEATTQYTYDEVGNLATTVDPRPWITTSYQYDDRNRRQSVKNEALDETTTVLYDDAGNKKRETRPDGAFRTWDYDAMNRLWHAYDWRTNEEPTANQTTTYQNDHSGNVLSITDTKNAVYSFLYDELNRKKSATYPGDNTVPVRTETWLYDIAGNLALHKNAAGQYQHFDYDERNRRRRSYWNTLPSDTTPNWSVGPEITTTPDEASRIREIKTNGGETIVGFGYDDANRQIWEDQTVGGRTRRVTTLRDQDGRRSSLEIGDPPIEGGNLTFSPEMAGSGLYSISYQYTERNQLLHIIGDGAENWSFTYGYDKSGNMTARRADYNDKTSWTKAPNEYDARNRATSWEQSGPNGIYALSHYRYDRANREEATWRAENNNRGERFEYEVTNQLKKVSYNVTITPTPAPPSPTPPNATPTPPNATPTPPNATPTPGQQVEMPTFNPFHLNGYNYHPANTVPITITTTTTGAQIRWTNDGSDPTSTLGTLISASSGVITSGYRESFPLKAVAFRPGWGDSAVMEGYYYWDTGEAPSAASRTVIYTHTPDKLNRGSMNDNGTVTHYSPNALNQYTNTAGNSFSYDDNYNLTHSAGFNGVYDAANHLVVASNGGSGEAQPTIAGFVYDGLGRCVKRTLNDVSTVFIYDGWKPVAEWDEWKEYFQAWNVYGAGPDEILLRHQGNMGYLRFQLDRHGNVAFLVDNDAVLIEKYTFDAFGQPKITDATGTVVRSFSHYEHSFLFQGREYIRQLGIYDFRNRFFHPGLGRFIQTDPIGLQTEGAKLSQDQKALYVGGIAPETFGSSELNLYRYCNNDPVNGADPFGLLTYKFEKGFPKDGPGGQKAIERAIEKHLRKTEEGRKLLDQDGTVIIRRVNRDQDFTGTRFSTDPKVKKFDTYLDPTDSRFQDPGTFRQLYKHKGEIPEDSDKGRAAIIGHEFAHGVYKILNEARIIREYENVIRGQLGLPIRRTSNGEQLY
jgi:RHS repeat-associated protein